MKTPSPGYLIWADDLSPNHVRPVASRAEAVAFLREQYKDSGERASGMYLDTELAWAEDIAEWELQP